MRSRYEQDARATGIKAKPTVAQASSPAPYRPKVEYVFALWYWLLNSTVAGYNVALWLIDG
mgnify:CR=1 FL=1